MWDARSNEDVIKMVEWADCTIGCKVNLRRQKSGLLLITHRKMKDKEVYTAKELVPFVVRQFKEVETFLAKTRRKLGPTYNNNNALEQAIRHFAPFKKENALRYAEEYCLITHKASKQPSVVRLAIKTICEPAVMNLVANRAKAKTAKEKSK